MKKIENNTNHIARQIPANKQQSSKFENQKNTVISKDIMPECIYGADNKPTATIFHGF